MIYHFHITDKSGQTGNTTTTIACADDEMAVDHALQFFNTPEVEAVEVRKDDRLVVRLQPEAEKDY